MKRIKHISSKVQVQVVEDYRAKNPDGTYTFTLKQIASKHEISLSTVNNLARISKVQGRPKIGKKLIVPDARTMKLLRDATEMNITLEEVGRRNWRWVTEYPRYFVKHNRLPGTYWSKKLKKWVKTENPISYSHLATKKLKREILQDAELIPADDTPVGGRRVKRALTKQRVSQLITFWKKRGNPGLRTKGFKPGDVIRWSSQTYTVIRYDDARKGAVKDSKGFVIDPFHWVHLGARSKLVTSVPTAATTPEAVPAGEVSKA